MQTHYYLSVFPLEALIASQLEPNHFGAYMATGSKRGSEEQIVFIEVKGEFGKHFDWGYAHERCVPHDNGDPKHSVYLGVYRVLEQVPLESLGAIYLTTRDGRTLEIGRGDYTHIEQKRDYYVYQELCPINPVIVSRLDPETFAKDICAAGTHVHVPQLVFTDLKVINVEDEVNTGNIGPMYHRRKGHLVECIAAVQGEDKKPNKTFTRTNVESFSFQIINHGIYATDGKSLVMYKMPSLEELKHIDYDWGRSALII